MVGPRESGDRMGRNRGVDRPLLDSVSSGILLWGEAMAVLSANAYVVKVERITWYRTRL